MRTIKIKCPAKINLNLKITGRRDDGFHNIESIMQTINLFDYLTITVEDFNENKIILSGNSNEIPYDERNLVYKAAKLFLEKTGITNKKISINIEKNIPVAAGLAGGSTDAAGTIFGLNKIFNLLSETQMHELCSKLGSDLNVCLKGGRILAKGRGEIIEPLKFEEFILSLIKPLNLGISAKEAYTKFSEKLKLLPPTVLRTTSPLQGAEELPSEICPLSGGNVRSTKGVRLYPYIKTFSRKMRKQMTAQELKLWQYIRKKQLGVKFRRQHPIDNRYIADFACLENKLIIEIDGSQHVDSIKDEFRTYYLEKNEYKIIRFYNNDIDNNIEGCIEYLLKVLQIIPPTVLRTTSPLQGAEELPSEICPLSGGNVRSTKGVDKSLFENDLEWAVIDDYKELQYIKEKYPKSVMTGSGSTYFVIDDEFEDEKDYWVKNNLESVDYGITLMN